MPFHWLDTNVFIQAKNGPYAFDLVPSFWTWLKQAAEDDLVRSPSEVYRELQKQKDQLSRWVRINKSCNMFANPDKGVQEHMRAIAAFVQTEYAAPQAARFLSGADPWVIAHAMEDHGVVVTHEVLSTGKEVKIPNICNEFSVGYSHAYDALRKLGMKI